MAVNSGQGTPVSKLNDVMGTLVEPLALQAIYTVPSTNPLHEVFEREAIEDGAEVQEILLGDANIEAYDADGETALKPRDVKAVARYYNSYEHPVYVTTVYRNEIRKVSLNPENATGLASKIVAQLTATRDDDLYTKEKKVLKDVYTMYAQTELLAGTITAGTKAEMSAELTEMIRNTIDALTFKNDKFLLHNVNHPTNKFKTKAFFDRIRIIIPYKIKNAIDVGFLANVYNLEKTDLLAKMITIDTDDGIVYVIDKMSVFRYPQTDELLGQDNSEGGFRNEFLHVNQMLGASTLFKFAFIDASAFNPAPENGDEVVEA